MGRFCRLLSLVAITLISNAATADIILSYHESSFAGPAATPIPNSLAIGPAISSLNMLVGQTKYIQVCIEGNNTAPVPPQQTAWTSGNGLISFGFAMNYPSLLPHA